MLLGRQLFQLQIQKQFINDFFLPTNCFSFSFFLSVLKYVSTNTFILINYSLNYEDLHWSCKALLTCTNIAVVQSNLTELLFSLVQVRI